MSTNSSFNSNKISWDDYRIFLQVANSGSLYGASKQLSLNHSTIFRRIKVLEESLKTRLFERLPSGYVLTAAGEQLFTEIKGLNEKIDLATNQILGRDISLRGNIRLAVSDTLGFSVLPDLIQKFHQKHPEILVELIISTQMYDLSKRQADIALRVTNDPPQHLFGKKIGDIKVGILSAKKSAKIAKKKTLEELLEQEKWVLGCEELANQKNTSWLMKKCPSRNFVAAANHMMAIASIVKSGIGFGVIPIYLAKIFPTLVVHHRVPELDSEMWILTHYDMRQNAKIKVLMQFLNEEIKTILKT